MNLTLEASGIYILGKQTVGGHKQNLVHTRSQEKGAVSSQETESDMSVSVQESLVEAWVWPQANKQGGNTDPSINRKLD